ncbi:MAG: hypothetical protein WBQ04_20405 [Candidatus Acidiferrales bacterium]
MKMQGRFGLAAAVLLVLPTFSQAQHATGTFRAAPSAPASAPVAHSTAMRAHTATRSSGARVVRAASPTRASAGANVPADLVGSDGLSVQQILNPFPSDGFDFAHLAAIHKDHDIKALIDPATQVKLALAERRMRRKPKAANGFIFLDGGGAYVLPVVPGTDLNSDADAQVAQQQGQDQGQDGQAASEERAPRESQQMEQLEADNARLAQEQSESLPDEGEFTLILRSGQEIEAVAFTRVDDRIVYITLGGGRRAVAVRELDVDATVRLNQERGTPLQIPL